MRHRSLKAVVAAALIALPSVAHAEPQVVMAPYSSLTQFFGLGGSTFDVQFLYGKQANSVTLFYQTWGVDAPTVWTKILETSGVAPNPTTNPSPGTIFPVSGSFTVGGVGAQFVRFAACTGQVANFAACSPATTFMTSAPASTSTNWRTLTSATWNGTWGGQVENAAVATRSTVFALEDTQIPVSDSDFGDAIFATNLQVVPEPSTIGLMAAGLLGLAVASRRRKNA